MSQPDTWLALADPESKVHGANMGPSWVLSALDGPHVGPMNLAIRGPISWALRRLASKACKVDKPWNMDFRFPRSLWSLTGVSTACQDDGANFRTTRPYLYPISLLLDCKTSYHLVNRGPGALDNKKYPPAVILNSNLAKCRSSMISVSIVQSFWNHSESMTMISPCVLQNFVMIAHLDSHQALTLLNHGFRAKHSCETQLLITMQDLVRAQTDVAVLDFSKAFDKVPHGRLMKKLRLIGIEGNIAQWVDTGTECTCGWRDVW